MMRLRIDVTEDDDTVTVKFKTTSEHLRHCPHCLALMALRVADSFSAAVQDAIAREAGDEVAEERHGQALH